MKEILISTILISSLLISCKAEKQDPMRLFLESQNQNFCNDLSNAGWETKYIFMEMSEDKTNPIMRERALTQLKYYNLIDDIATKNLKAITDVKIQILGKSAKLQKNKIDPSDLLRIPVFDLTKVKGSLNEELRLSELPAEIDLEKLITNYRNELCRIIVKSNFHSEEQNYHFDPPVANVKNLKDLNKLIEKSFSSNNVSLDDRETIKMIYSDLTLTEAEKSFLKMAQDGLSIFGYLTQLQTRILRARSEAFMVMSSRMCIASYRFDKILPLAYGPETVGKNEKFEIQILTAAFDSQSTPIVTTNNGKVARVHDGKAFILVEGLKPGIKKLKGTITIMNKSGIPKTLTWKKEVFVTE